MKRSCPACDTGEISVLRLAASHRTGCRSCKSRIGYHWIFGAVFDLLILVPFGIVAFLVTLDFGLAPGAALFVIGLAVINLLAAQFGPLEAKTRRLQP